MRAHWFHVNRRLICGKKCGFRHIRICVDRGPFLERPGNFSVPKANFKIQTFWIVAQFLARKPVNFASLLTDSFIVLVSKFLKVWTWMQTRQTQNSFPGPKSYRNFRETGPCMGLHVLRKIDKVPCSFSLHGLHVLHVPIDFFWFCIISACENERTRAKVA